MKRNLWLETLIELVNERGSINALTPTLEQCYYLNSKGVCISKSNNPYFVILTLDK